MLTSGCLTPRGMEGGAPEVKVTVGPKPEAILPLPAVDTNRVEIALVPAAQSSLIADADRRFAAAREAFWNRDTVAAEALLRGLLPDAKSDSFARLLQRLIADCQAEDGKWGEAVARWEEFKLTDHDPDYYRHALFMAGLPERAFAFATNALPVSFDLRLGQLVVTTVRINGHEAMALIDTGFSMSFVTEEFSERCGLKTFAQTIPLTDANGNDRAVKLGLVEQLEVGGLRATQIPVVCGPNRQLAKLLGEVEVVVGWDVLQHADVIWDFSARQMSVAAPDGPIESEPSLAGRKAPLLKVYSAEGRELDLFLDTGFASRPAGVSLAKNAGLLFTKVVGDSVRLRWRPTMSMGMNSFRVRWPSRIQPFQFWMDDCVFELPQATVTKRVDVREGLQTCDGTVGNAPFLKGRLRLCGVRRLATYTAVPVTH